MSNEIAKIETIDYSALDAAIGNNIDGDPLRFKDGEFLRGFDKVTVPLGTRFVAHPASTARGYQRWEDGKPTDLKIRTLNDPKQLPIFREGLGDDDESQWPEDKDPWSPIMMIAMKDTEGVRVTFSTSSVGGENALFSFLRDFKLIRHKHPNQVPVVEIGVGSYVHKVHKKKVEYPTFTIVAWTTWDEGDIETPSPKALTSAERVREALEGDDLPDWAKSQSAA